MKTSAEEACWRAIKDDRCAECGTRRWCHCADHPFIDFPWAKREAKRRTRRGR